MSNRENKGKYTTQDLVEILFRMKMTEGLSRSTILTFLKKDLGYCKTSAYELMQLLNDYIAEIYKERHLNDIDIVLGQYEELRERAFRQGNLKLAADILEKECKLKGYDRLKIEHSGKLEWIAKFGSDKEE